MARELEAVRIELGYARNEIESLRQQLAEANDYANRKADEKHELAKQLAVAKSNEQATHEANKVMAKQLAECERERDACEDERTRLKTLTQRLEDQLAAPPNQVRRTRETD